MKSVPPPGVDGMIILIGWSGQACAWTVEMAPNVAVAATATIATMGAADTWCAMRTSDCSFDYSACCRSNSHTASKPISVHTLANG